LIAERYRFSVPRENHDFLKNNNSSHEK